MPKKPSPRLIKTHRVYTPVEAASALGVHKQTILRWIKNKGLYAVRSGGAWLIEGRDLKAFLGHRQSQGRCKLKTEEIYCLPCRTAQVPAERMADFKLQTSQSGQLIGLCPVCERTMHKAVRRGDLDRIRAILDVTFQQAQPRIVGEPHPPVTVTLKEEQGTHAKKHAG
jgi:excisionase family DNA binding protein